MKEKWIRRNKKSTTVIFIHGILSDGECCWTHDNGTYWPALLESEPNLSEFDIYSFTYNTGIFSGSYQLSDAADALKEELSLDGLINQNQQLVFVCHSMGGIVARKFIIDKQAVLIEKNIQIGLFLIASPSLGSKYANWITNVASWLKVRNAQADILRTGQGNTWLNDLDKGFVNLKEAKKLRLIGKELIEDQPIILRKFLRRQVVEPFSGAKYFGEPFKVAQSDHSTIAKPKDNSAIQHRLLKQFIKDMREEMTKVDTGMSTYIQPSDQLVDTLEPAVDIIERRLTKKLRDGLSSFASQPTIWVDRTLSPSPEVATDEEKAKKITTDQIISSTKSFRIKAPPQFGLTCLAHFLIREAWISHSNSYWLYLDSKALKPNMSSIENAMNEELDQVNKKKDDIACVILDSWTSDEKDASKLLDKVISLFPGRQIILMQTLEMPRLDNLDNEKIPEISFETLYLWCLSRADVRCVVTSYNEINHIGNENSVVKKIVADLDVLNMHRTPLNCITLLKVFEFNFDDSPVNRAEIIRRVLFLLFNIDDIPSYKARPDLKDCEYVLGYFCEQMVRENTYTFSREAFRKKIGKYCRDRLIDLEVDVVFDVLYANNILVKRDSIFCFKFAYWICYFIAQRMLQDETFKAYILNDMHYARFPEVIEFYTGTDRQREDALRVLIKDVRLIGEAVADKLGFPEGMNPYRFAQWKPSTEMLEQMKTEIDEGIKDSHLPNSIKDAYADQQYDRTRPYRQEIQGILTGYSFLTMMQTMRAGARALRNSDYVDPDIKRNLLDELMRCWMQTCNVLLILTPVLAHEGRASFEGYGYVLKGNFGETLSERIMRILGVIPHNIVLAVEDDLYSQKMGPLLVDKLRSEKNELKRHILALLLITQRPRGWETEIEKYIEEVDKNSFYLLDVYATLRAQYRYAYLPSTVLREFRRLIKKTAAKHWYGSKAPGQKLINKISSDVIPQRLVDEEDEQA